MVLLKIIISYLAVLGPVLYQFLDAWRAAGYPLDAASLIQLLILVASGAGALMLHQAVPEKVKVKYGIVE